MIKINLLDWRAAQRERNKKEFYVWLGGAVIIGIALVYLANQFMVGAIDAQKERNQYLEQQIQIAERKTQKIKHIKKVRERLKGHIQTIAELQRSRTRIVHLFDSLVSTVPNGLYITKIHPAGNEKVVDTEKTETVIISGIANSNGAIVNYLRNLDHSSWLADPSLMVISSDHSGSSGAVGSSFNLSVKLVSPTDSGKKDSGKKGSDQNHNRRQS